MRKRIVCLQHDSIDGPGLIVPWAEARGHELHVVTETGAPPSAAEAMDLLVILGGSASALDRTPRQLEERALARAVAERGRPVLGVCLGAQMLALEFGGDVLSGAAAEHDWSAIEVQSAWLQDALGSDRPIVFQAHDDAIRPPPGAAPLASSRACPVQAFRGPGSVVGLQFHLEADAEKIRAFRRLRGREAADAGDEDRLALCRDALHRLLDPLLAARSG